jgi:hypothetical protein
VWFSEPVVYVCRSSCLTCVDGSVGCEPVVYVCRSSCLTCEDGT